MEFIWFMLFSTIEGMAVYSLILYLFRFDLKRYVIPVLIIVTLMNLQSFFIREDTDLFFLVPVINLVFSILFMKVYVKIPIVGALISSFIGYLTFSLIQVGLTYTLFGSIAEAKSSLNNGYILQLLSGSASIVIAKLLHQFGIGITNDFDKFTIKFEREIIIVLSIVFCIVFGVILFIGDLHIVLIFLLISMIAFIYYAIQKEREDVNKTTST